MIILGGGVIKHHITNACLMGNGAESPVYNDNTLEFDIVMQVLATDEVASWNKDQDWEQKCEDVLFLIPDILSFGTDILT
jgi:deoxyhypusine synthase